MTSDSAFHVGPGGISFRLDASARGVARVALVEGPPPPESTRQQSVRKRGDKFRKLNDADVSEELASFDSSSPGPPGARFEADLGQIVQVEGAPLAAGDRFVVHVCGDEEGVRDSLRIVAEVAPDGNGVAVLSKTFNGIVVAGPIYGVPSQRCVVCLDAERDTMTIPCLHLALCKSCAVELSSRSSACPVCRGTFDSLYRIAPSPGEGA